jgi:hypothetical protein
MKNQNLAVKKEEFQRVISPKLPIHLMDMVIGDKWLKRNGIKMPIC